ncbi:hypothetical protein [Catenuloplanes japonicus]|uniref:hypothetical protein n=1 Tax=Catenuloplanes japonicus TaxID=33876 RepID=UPI000B2DF2DB|nr:hypothetical protein [Catenuloplanes japonicus]
METEVQDLSRMKVREILQQDPARFATTLRNLIGRIDQPGRSISGYNPQRLDG